MPLFSRAIFQLVHWAARKGLRDDREISPEQRKRAARRAGVRGETYAYWYLRKHGYIFVARNYTPRGIKGESISSAMMARRWPLWKSERAPSGNNTWWFARPSDFWQNVTSANVPAGLM